MAFRGISQAREMVVAALQAGYNDAARAAAAAYGIPERLLVVDFSPAKARFFRADIDPEMLEAAEPASFPYLMVFVDSISEGGDVWKPSALSFRGEVAVSVNLHISVLGNKLLARLEDVSDAGLEALIEVLGAPGVPWAGGRIEASKDPVVMAGDDWIKTVRVRLTIPVEG